MTLFEAALKVVEAVHLPHPNILHIGRVPRTRKHHFRLLEHRAVSAADHVYCFLFSKMNLQAQLLVTVVHKRHAEVYVVFFLGPERRFRQVLILLQVVVKLRDFLVLKKPKLHLRLILTATTQRPLVCDHLAKNTKDPLTIRHFFENTHGFS